MVHGALPPVCLFGLSFAKVMQCYRPLVYNDLLLPCGKCVACRVNKRQALLNRVDSVTSRGVFFTLTYDEESVPRINGRSRFVYRNNGDILFFDDFNSRYPLDYGINVDLHYTMVLLKKDVVDFIKRFRKFLLVNICNDDKELFDSINFRYFVSGEYSPKLRPHFHGCFWFDTNQAFSKDDYSYRWLRWQSPRVAQWISSCWSYCDQHRITRFTSELGSDAVSKYCLKYVTKHSLSPNDNFFREFTKYSQRLGYDSRFVRKFYKVIFEQFGNYSAFLASEISDTCSAPTFIRTFLARPYRCGKDSYSTTISRIESTYRKVTPLEDIHSDDLNFIRSWQRCRLFYLPAISLSHFYDVVLRFYYTKSMYSLKDFYLNYDVKNYKITFFQLISLPNSNKVRNLILKLIHHLNIDASFFNDLVKQYAIENNKKISSAYQIAFEKLYPFEK